MGPYPRGTSGDCPTCPCVKTALITAKTCWLGIRIMCPSGATCLPTGCCFSEQGGRSYVNKRVDSNSYQRGLFWSLDIIFFIENKVKKKVFKQKQRGLRCLTPLSTIFQLYRGGQFHWWRKLESLEKTTDLSVASHWQSSSDNVVSSTPRLNQVRTHNVSDDRHWLHR
jgi:hypothetical protein